ncbi:hypothetical protein RRG08_036613 [Elysia crispata]|uniref:Uncharacterized protein n=1 Tax=Elysia crispata TaxID=231223 RepID=A0AAE1DLL5_9GAST|nr:hypothetical protein RRG08_036613 [Elysia crispata]
MRSSIQFHNKLHGLQPGLQQWMLPLSAHVPAPAEDDQATSSSNLDAPLNGLGLKPFIFHFDESPSEQELKSLLSLRVANRIERTERGGGSFTAPFS